MSTFIIITGMHRSGTSFLARALNLSGVHLGEHDMLTHTNVNPHPTNTHGHWEHEKLQLLADQTLALTSGTWDNVPQKIAYDKDIGLQVEQEVRLLREAPAFACGFKDPRTLLVLDAWKSHLPAETVLIGIFRHPAKVIKSLQKRDNVDELTATRLWKQYNERLLKHRDDFGGFLINFEWPVERLSKEFEHICAQLHLPFVGIDRWFNPVLQHQDQNLSSDLPADITALYEQLQSRSQLNRNNDLHIPEPDKSRLRDIATELLRQLEKQSIFYKETHDNDKTQDLIQRQQAYIGYLEEQKNIDALHAQIRAQQSALDEIYNSRTWKILRGIDKLTGRQ